jgi:hypothetical protein
MIQLLILKLTSYLLYYNSRWLTRFIKEINLLTGCVEYIISSTTTILVNSVGFEPTSKKGISHGLHSLIVSKLTVISYRYLPRYYVTAYLTKRIRVVFIYHKYKKKFSEN